VCSRTQPVLAGLSGFSADVSPMLMHGAQTGLGLPYSIAGIGM
jgi:hypothetical protein